MEYKVAGVDPSPEDLRDIPYASPFLPEELPNSVDLRSWVLSVEQQGSIGSCVANGVTSACEMIAEQHGDTFQFSRMFLYNATKAYEGRLGESGLFTRNAYKVARKFGMPPEDEYPYDLAQDDKDPPMWAYAAAEDYRVERFERVLHWRGKSTEEKIHDVKSALHEGMPVGFAMVVNESIYDMKGDPDFQYYTLNGRGKKVIGGHFMVIVGYDDFSKRFIVLNSWGEDWGYKGYGYFPYTIVDESFCEGYVVRQFNEYEVEREVGVHLERASKYHITATIVPPPEMEGKTVSVWMAAKHTPSGTIYVRQPRSELTGTAAGLEEEVWLPLHDVGLTPVVTDYLLGDDNLVDVMTWTPLLAEFSDVDFYVGFGEDLLTMQAYKVHSI